MEPIDVAFQVFKKLCAEPQVYWDGVTTEADVRLRVVDRVFIEVLGWPREEIHLENQAGDGFIDYRLTVSGLSRLIVEAKRDSRDLGTRPEASGRFFKLNGPVFALPSIREGIEQAIRYCGHKNAELACVTNGRQWVVFRGNRLGDGSDTLDGKACVFGSLMQIARNFHLFYRLLSYDTVSRLLFRSEFQHAECQPGRTTNFARSLRRPDSKVLMPADKLLSDLDRVMTAFFRNLTGDDDPELLSECFVRSRESDRAETRLARISEDLLTHIKSIDTDEGQELTDAILRVKETLRNEFVLLVGTKGSGKTTFTERFFKKILPRDVARQCVVIRLDLGESEGDEKTVTEWLNRTLLEAVEQAIFPNGLDFDHIQGMYFDEYRRWQEGTYKHLYERDKGEFKVRFGDHVERLRRDQPNDYISRMLAHVWF